MGDLIFLHLINFIEWTTHLIHLQAVPVNVPLLKIDVI